MTEFSCKIQREVYKAQHGYCASKNCVDDVTNFYYKLSNTADHQKRWPLFLKSPFNCVGLCASCFKKGNRYIVNISDSHADMYEKWLRNIGKLKK